MAVDGPMKRTSSLVKRQNAEDDDRTLRTRLTSPSTEEEARALPPQHPQTSEARRSEYRPGRFKAVSQLVVAMNRFKGVSHSLSYTEAPARTTVVTSTKAYWLAKLSNAVLPRLEARKAASNFVLRSSLHYSYAASLNPTYTFGKRSESGNSIGWARDSPESDAQVSHLPFNFFCLCSAA